WFEVFAKGTRKPAFDIKSDAPWIIVSEDTSPPRGDRRFWVDIDWNRLPTGDAKGTIVVSGGQSDYNRNPGDVQIHVKAIKASVDEAAQAKGRFASLGAPIAIEASQPSRRIAAGGAAWEVIPDYGRGPAAMAVFPVTAPSVLPPKAAPQLEYGVYLHAEGAYHVKLVLGPCMDSQPGRGMRIGVSFDDAPVQVLDLFEDRKAETFLGAGWIRTAKDNVRYLTSTHVLSKPGTHALKISMVDPGVVVEKIIIHQGELPPSYFGPPANNRV
ncbi:MAG: hypothetical protein ACXWKW_09810, partial [Asticcacaulis sp.]